MSEQKHTPGPFEKSGADLRNATNDTTARYAINIYRLNERHNRQDIHAVVFGATNYEVHANADLLMKAPELLEQLKQLKEENERLKVLNKVNHDK